MTQSLGKFMYVYLMCLSQKILNIYQKLLQLHFENISKEFPLFRCSGFLLDDTNCTLFLMEKEKCSDVNASLTNQQKIYINKALESSEIS